MDASWSTDAQAMQAIAAGDHMAFAKVHARLYPKLVRLATSVTCDREEARDVVQGAFVKLWKQAPRWEPRATLDTWMWTVTLRDCLSVRRRIARTFDHALTDETRSAEDVVADRQARERLRTLVGNLSPRERAIVTLHLDEERSPQQIAELVGMSDGACRTALSRALSRIRERMEARHGQ